MRALFNRGVLLGILFIIISVSLSFIKPANYLSNILPVESLHDSIPSNFTGWRAEQNLLPIVTSPDVESSLDDIYDQILNRKYIDSLGNEVFLTITYGTTQVGKKKAHRQEFCYAAQGFTINRIDLKKWDIANKRIDVVQLDTKKPGLREVVSYWFTLGEYVVIDKYERLMVQIKYALYGTVPDGFLVRVSTHLQPGQSLEESIQIQKNFINSLFNNLDHDLKVRLLGV